MIGLVGWSRYGLRPDVVRDASPLLLSLNTGPNHLAPALLYAASVSIVSPVSMRDVSPVEDDVVTQKLAIEVPVQQGHSVEVAGNGSLTIDSFKVNVSMPSISGMEATDLISDWHRLASPAVIGDIEQSLRLEWMTA
ncbi:hypothetical protein JAAARDRAFT_43108 [Jaapia argillacea MUCL 33604]|uniref:Uncharacterized protein n=1 Tax=Jaapia argillacea MUCL 33604 TaxID=933084 RepID=A0A067P2W1_9AGAM|nr:hypothetical protein JAAARDRAFT_43108 [Jaapia argillacea MUCL 33604]